MTILVFMTMSLTNIDTTSYILQHLYFYPSLYYDERLCALVVSGGLAGAVWVACM